MAVIERQEEHQRRQQAEQEAAAKKSAERKAAGEAKNAVTVAAQKEAAARKRAERKAKNDALLAEQAASKAAKEAKKVEEKQKLERPSKPAVKSAVAENIPESDQPEREKWPVFAWNPDWDNANWSPELPREDKRGTKYTLSFLSVANGKKLMWDSRWPLTAKLMPQLPPRSRLEPRLGPSLSELGVLPSQEVGLTGPANEKPPASGTKQQGSSMESPTFQ